MVKVGDRVRYTGRGQMGALRHGQNYLVLGAGEVTTTVLGDDEKPWMLPPGTYELALAGDEVVLPNARVSAKPGDWLNGLSSAERKEVAVARGLFAYFPDALALVARHSVRSNEKHNPGQPVHWSREKSSDHEDCIARHSLSVAVDPDALDGDVPHIVCRAWRALAALQLWAEAKKAKGEKL